MGIVNAGPAAEPGRQKGQNMKTAGRRFTAGLVPLIAFGAALFVASSSAFAESEESGFASRLEGTWLIHLTQRDCTTGAAGPTFPALLSFARGGTMTETTGSPAFLPGQRSPGLGVWRKTDAHAYLTHDEAFILFSGGPFAAGMQMISHTITLSKDGNSFESVASSRFFDTAGNPLGPSNCGTSVGVRVE
jgi:hypothetical protein